MKAPGLATALLCLVSATAGAQELTCRSVDESQIRFTVLLDTQAAVAQLVLPDQSHVMSPLIIEDERYYFYELVPGSQDERVETRRMFRYEKIPGKVFFVDQDDGVFLHGDCHPVEP